MQLAQLVDELLLCKDAPSVKTQFKRICHALAQHNLPFSSPEFASPLSRLFLFAKQSPMVGLSLRVGLLLSLPKHLRNHQQFFPLHLFLLWQQTFAQLQSHSPTSATMQACLLYNYRKMLPLRILLEFCLLHSNDRLFYFMPHQNLTALCLLLFLLQRVANEPIYREAVACSGLLERVAAFWPCLCRCGDDDGLHLLLVKLLFSASLLMPSISVFHAPIGLVAAIADSYAAGKNRAWLLRLLKEELEKTASKQYVLSSNRLVLASIGPDVHRIMLKATDDLMHEADASFANAYLAALAAFLERWAEVSINLSDEDEGKLLSALSDLLDDLYWQSFASVEADDGSVNYKLHSKVLHCLSLHWQPWMKASLHFSAFRNALILGDKTPSLKRWSKLIAQDLASHWAFRRLFTNHPGLVDIVNKLLRRGRLDWLVELSESAAILDVLMDFVLDLGLFFDLLPTREGHNCQLDRVLLLMLKRRGGVRALQHWLDEALDLQALLIHRVKTGKNADLLLELFQTSHLAFDKDLLMISVANADLYRKMLLGYEEDVCADLHAVSAMVAGMPAEEGKCTALQMLKADRSWRDSLHAVLFNADSRAAARLLLFKAAGIVQVDVDGGDGVSPDFGHFLQPLFEALSGSDLQTSVQATDEEVDLVDQFAQYCKFGFESEALALEGHIIEHLDSELLLDVLRRLPLGLLRLRRRLAGAVVVAFFANLSKPHFLEGWARVARGIANVRAVYLFMVGFVSEDPGHSF